MEFILKEYHTNISKKEMIADLIRVAKELNTITFTQKQYKSIGKYSPDTISKHFDGWSNALEESGLVALRKPAKPRYRSASPDEIIADIQAVAKKLNVDTLISTTYVVYGKYSQDAATRIFGSWDNALIAAGLKNTGFHRNVSEIELMENIETMWITLGRQPTCNDLKSELSEYSIKPYLRLYGSWSNTLKRFIEYINDEDTYDNSKEQELDRDVLASGVVDKPIHNTKREISLRLRFKVMKRDNFKCCMCGATPATNPSVELHIDHIVPWSKGGETTFDNLQTLCKDCNLGKGNLI